VDGTCSESRLVEGFGISGVGTSDSVNREFVS
jgi:hypothetical protein